MDASYPRFQNNARNNILKSCIHYVHLARRIYECQCIFHDIAYLWNLVLGFYISVNYFCYMQRHDVSIRWRCKNVVVCYRKKKRFHILKLWKLNWTFYKTKQLLKNKWLQANVWQNNTVLASIRYFGAYIMCVTNISHRFIYFEYMCPFLTLELCQAT